MLITDATKDEVLTELKRYAKTLEAIHDRRNADKSKTKSELQLVADVYQTVRDKTAANKSIRIEVSEKELNGGPGKIIGLLLREYEIVANVFFGYQCSVYAKEKCEAIVRDAVIRRLFLTGFANDKIIVYLSVLDDCFGEMYRLDFATELLN